MYLTLQHQQYLNKALQLWNDGFFYSHTEYDIHVHFHLSWRKQIAHAIQTEREIWKTEYVTTERGGIYNDHPGTDDHVF